MADASAMRDTEWATQTCVVGFNTIGVWPESNEGSDIRVCARTNNNSLMVTGDELGLIRLYSNPAIYPKVSKIIVPNCLDPSLIHCHISVP